MDLGDTMMARLALAIFGGTGLLILGLGISSMLDQREFLATAPRAEAQVLRIEQRTTVTGSGSKRQRSVSDCAILEYRTADGELYQAEYSYGILEASFEAGDTASIYYDPEAPETVLVDGFAALWLGYLALLGLGLGFLGAGVLVHHMISPS